MCRTATPGGIAYPLTILANETSATRTFTYTPEDDSEPEPPEVVVLEVVASDGDLEPGTATLTIIDDDAASAITLSVSPEWVAEDAGGTTVTVTAALDAGTRPTATEVTVSRTGGTATSGTDHAAVDAFTVTIRAEQTSGTATFTFTPLDDSAADGAETVILSGSATGLETGTATLTITDDESVPTDILLSVSQESVAETAGATTVRVTVALDAGTRPTATFVLVVQTGGTATSGTDYAAVNDLALRIPPNETSATATFTFTPADDSLREAPETVIMDAAVLGVPDLGDWGDRATLTIIDDDAAALIKLSVSPDSVAEDAGPTTVTVTAALDGAARATATTVTVTRTGGTAILGSDYAPVQDFTVTIRAEQTSVTGTFTFTPLDDSAAESAETVVLGERMHNTVPAMLYIVDDDDDASTALELSVSPDSVAEDAGPTTITATVALNGVARTTATQVVVFVPFDDYGPGGGIAYPLTILANETSATRTFTYTPEDDSEPEPPEVVVLEVVAADGDLDRGTATLTIIDDDASTALELSVSPDSVAEDAGPTMITATVALNRAPRTTATPVFVSWIGGTATPGADYTSLDPMVLTIPADSASVTGTFTFTPLDDSAAESAETVILGAEPTVSSGLRSVAGDTATLTIIDDDASTALELSVSPDSVAEDAGATTVTVTAALDGAPRATATTVTVSDGGTGTAVSGTDYAAVNDFTLTIPADSASVTGTFAFTPLDDSAAESAETVVLSGSATGLETGTATLTIADAENSAPAFSDSTLTRSIAENTAADTNVGAVVPAATDTDAGDTLTYSMEGADTASFTFDAATRQIKTKSGVTYDHEAKSSYSVTVKVDDGNGGTDTVPVTVTVTDVAEPPLAPNAPTVTATAGSTTSLDVTWTAPTNTGKPAIDNYDLQYRVGTSGSFTAGPQNQTGLSASIGGLTANTSYEVQVHAHNDEGDGPWSPSGTGSTSSPTTAPDVPTGFMAFPVTPFGPASTLGKIGIAWDAAAGGTAPTGYQYQVDAGGGYGNWTTIPNSAPGEANATGYRIPSLKTTDHARNARPSHSVRLRAVSGAVEGAETDAITVDGFQFAFTVEAVDAAVDEGEDARFRVTVTLSPAGPDPNCAFDGAFTFISSVSSTGGVAPARVDQRRFDVCVSSETFSVPTTDDTTQEPNGTVTFTLSGKNNPDDGFFATPYPSATVTVRDDDSAATAPDAPSLAAGAGDGSVTLAWETPGDGGSAITGYEYRQSTDGGANFGAWTSIPNSASLNSYTVRTNIANGTTYTFEVRAVNALGESDESNRVSVTPPGDRPENMKAVPGNRQIGISWDPPSAGGNAPILDYAWRQSPDGTDWGPWQSVGGRSVRGQVVKELTNGQPYYFQARARDRFGWGPASNTVSATPNPTWRLSTALEGMVRGGVTNATRVTITNSGTFATDETIELRWKGTALTGEIRGRDIVIPAGENHGTTTLSARTDGGTEHFDLPSRGTLSARWNGRIIGSRTLTIHDDEAKPVIGMSVSKAEVVEGEDIEIAVKAGPTGFALQTSVEIHVTDPNGRLIAAADRTVTFATGETSKSVTMGTVDDSEKHRDQPVIFGLHRPFTDHASESYTLSNEPGEGLVEVLVRDNDETRPEMPEMWVSDAKAYEVNKRMVFGVFLDREATTDVSVDYTTRDGSARAGQDYTATSGTLVFEPGDRVKAIFVPIIDDSVRDDGETFTIKLSNVSGAEFRDDEATGTIHNSEEEPELSVADAEATEEEDNTLDFVVTLDPAAGAAGSVDYATADGTATAGADYTATSGTLTFVAGDTEKTIAVPIIDDTVDDGGETFTLTLGNASGATIADASATGTIRNREETSAPLTASFGGVPASHDGATAFTFGLTFSEDVAGLSYKTLRDSALSVTNGRATRARRRTQGNNQGWTITVEPDSPAAVTVRLPAGSVVTSDGRGLESAVSATVAGPVGISVADARAREGTDAAIDFAVSLSRAASGTVTVDYATANGSAQAGADYTATSGTLTFAVGQTSKTVSVAVLDDSHDDGGETFTLRLSNALSGARIADAQATGTIDNTDPLPRALLARFGRATALHVMDQVEERLEASRTPGLRGRFAGRELRRGMERDMGRNFLSRLESTAVAGARDTTGVQSGLSGSELLRTGLGGGDVLMGSGFVLNRETGGGASVSLWSRGMESRFSGRDGELSLDGGVRTTMFGADYAKGPLMAGLMLSHRRGLGGYQGAGVGEVASSVTGLHPWVGYKLTERVTLWGVTGYGRGSLSLMPGEATGFPMSVASPLALEGGLSMSMLAGGMRGDLVDSGVGGFGLAFKADALWVGTGSEAVAGPAGRLAATEAVVTRVRTALEASRGYVFGHGIALRPSLELGLRRDGGDAETGTGADVAASLIASDPLTGLSVDVRVRTLLVHQARGFRDRGVSVSLSYDPTPSTPLGFTARVAPSWGGQAMSGAEALWGRDTMQGLARAGSPAAGNQLDAELGYALPVGSRLVGTPRFGVTTTEMGRDYRLGYSLAVLQGGAMNFQFDLDAQRRESPLGQGNPDHSLMGRVTATW